MACLFTEGFDKYGPVGTLGIASASSITLLLQEWTSWYDRYGGINLVSPLSSGNGSGISFSTSTGTSPASALMKTLATNYSTLSGGFRFTSPLGSLGTGVSFLDAGSYQCSITFNTNGTISVVNGSVAGSIIATSSASLVANTINYLEWQITFGASASYQVWLNGVSIISGTGNTKTTANNYANSIGVGVLNAGSTNITMDDFYLFDNTTSINNAPLLTNPIIETQYPVGDSSVAFTTGTGVLGQAYYTTAGVNSPGANELVLRLFTPTYNCTLNGIGLLPQGTSGTANLKAVIYSTSGSVPGALLNVGTQVTGTTAGSALNLPFASSNSLVNGTQYAIGLITDTSVVLQQVAGASTGQKAANTYTSGAPNTAPVMTTAQADWMIWGNISGMTSHYTQSNENPSLGALSYNQSSTPGQTDLYNFPALSASTGNIYTVSVKNCVEYGVFGARTVGLQVNSSGNVSAGSLGNVSLAGSFTYIDSMYDTDPNTGSPWTVAALNSATSGITIVT